MQTDKVNLGTEINTTKETSENMPQPGIEPGSLDYWSDAFAIWHPTMYHFVYCAKLRVTENRCVLFDPSTYVYFALLPQH